MSFSTARGQRIHPRRFVTAIDPIWISYRGKRFCMRRDQDNVILGNSFVPSYFRPLRKIPYVAWSNFLATAMSACRRALFRAKAIKKGLCVGIATGCDQGRHVKRSSQVTISRTADARRLPH
jgi:hypothetical protein